MTAPTYDLSAFRLPLRACSTGADDGPDVDQIARRVLELIKAESQDPAGEGAGEEADQDEQGAEENDSEGQPDENAQALQAAQERADKAEAEVRALRLRTAFLEGNAARSEPFKDPATAYGLVTERDGIDVQEDGTVVGLAEAMEAVAEKYPYLVDDSKAEAERDPDITTATASGNRKRQTTTNHLSKAALMRKYPALRSR